MNLKYRVLNVLSQTDGYVSGGEMAALFSVSRTSVWKAVNELRRDGHSISTVNKLGYRLDSQTDIVNPDVLKDYLDKGFANSPQKPVFKIELLDEVDSTNEFLKRIAAKGADEISVVIAERQTKGKGRNGKSFFSPSDCGLYISLLLRPRFNAREALFLTAAASVAGARAVDDARRFFDDNAPRLEPKTQIKWVNDLFLNGKKICGILTEGCVDMESNGLSYAVVGAGFNVFPPPHGFPEQLKSIAGAIYPSKPDKAVKSLFAARFVRYMTEFYLSLPEHSFMEEYKRKSCVVGKNITFLRAGETLRGTAIEIDDDCRLTVAADDGRIMRLDCGEISISEINDYEKNCK